jgi:hypothetical protein
LEVINTFINFTSLKITKTQCMTDYEKEIEDKFYQVTIPLNEKKSIYGISLDGFKLAVNNLMTKAVLEGKIETLNEVRVDLKNIVTTL